MSKASFVLCAEMNRVGLKKRGERERAIVESLMISHQFFNAYGNIIEDAGDTITIRKTTTTQLEFSEINEYSN